MIYDVLIIWGWVSGASLLYTLSKFTNLKTIGLLEKYHKPGLVNSKATNNSQTLHSGDIETNYNLAKATKVKKKADMLKRFLEEEKKHEPATKLFTVYNKMILAVGKKEVADLEHRYEDFKNLFPTLHRVERKEIEVLEPSVVEWRDPNEPILALSSPEWYTIDYGLLSEVFVKHARKADKQIDIYYDTLVDKVEKTEFGYKVTTQDWKYFECRTLVVSAWGHTPLIAQSMGYVKNFSILSVAGTFFKSTRKILNGKVYTMQMEKLPFAAVHGDPDVHNADETRFGPTAKWIFMLERYNYKSVWEYFKVFGFRRRAFQTIFKLVTDPVISPYLAINTLYDLPWIGKRLFVRELRKIVPTLTADDIVHGDKLGGTRPQILNLDTKELEMWEAKIIWDKVIFNITPSPGATTCLWNAYEDAQTIMKFFEWEFEFDKEEFDGLYVK